LTKILESINGSLIDYCVTALSFWPSLTAETTDRKLDLDAAVGGDAVESFFAGDERQVADGSVVTAQSTDRLICNVRVPQPHEPVHSCHRQFIIARDSQTAEKRRRQWYKNVSCFGDVFET